MNLKFLKDHRSQLFAGFGLLMVLALLGLTTALSLQKKQTVKVTGERDVLATWQKDVISDLKSVTEVVDEKTGKPITNWSPDTAKLALKNLIKERNDKRKALVSFDRINRQIIADNKARDAQLAKAQSKHTRDFAKAVPIIHQLEAQRSTGGCEADIEMIDNAADAAWTGWTK